MQQDDSAAPQSDVEECRRPPLTMHGVLHFLKHECDRYETERSNWELERAELQTKISFLLGERRAQENLKKDLIRRIKMLEHTLDQERLVKSGQQPADYGTYLLIPNLADNSRVPVSVDAIENETLNSQTWNNTRQVLRHFLQEIGYSEKFLSVRSFRAKGLLASVLDNDDLPFAFSKTDEKTPIDREKAADRNQDSQPETSGGYTGAGEKLAQIDDDDSDPDITDEKKFNTELLDALNQFSFL